MSQAFRAGKIATTDETKVKQILDEVGKLIGEISMESTPPETGRLIYQLVNEISGNSDPFKEIKKKNMEEAISLQPLLDKIMNDSNDKLLSAIRLAVAGNVIDLGVDREFDIEASINEILTKDFAIFDYDKFKQSLAEVDEILYLADNAGEAVFDKILIKELAKPVTYAVKENPVLNDATMSEAKFLGIDKIAKVISSGITAPGTILEFCSDNFNEIFNSSKMIISKGQGNFEGLSNVDAPIFFILKAKCNVIANDLGQPIDSIIIKSQQDNQ